MRESSKESWGYAGHQSAVIVVLLVIKEISVLEDSQIVIYIENGFNSVVVQKQKVDGFHSRRIRRCRADSVVVPTRWLTASS